MQESTEVAEASLPTENVRDGQTLNGTGTVCRQAAKRTFPWNLAVEELHLMSPPQLASLPNDDLRRKAAKRTFPWDLAAEELLVSQDDDIPAMKKPRHEKPVSASTDETVRKLSPNETALSLPAASAAADDDADADADPVNKCTKAVDYWTIEEDAKLASAVTNTHKKKWYTDYRTDWLAVAALVPGRTKVECWSRWHDALDPSIDQVSGLEDSWTAYEESTLKDATQTHGATTSLFPVQTKSQCYYRWKDALDPSIDGTGGRTGQWTEDEDIKLGNALQRHGDKKWGAIAALVPGRVEKQCWTRWNYFLDLSIDRSSERMSQWTAVEDVPLRNAVQSYGVKNWAAIAALVPGRTKSQRNDRWKKALDPSIDRASGRTGKWRADEDITLMNAVQTHGGKNWAAIAALVPGRVEKQCYETTSPSLRDLKQAFRSPLHRQPPPELAPEESRQKRNRVETESAPVLIVPNSKATKAVSPLPSRWREPTRSVVDSLYSFKDKWNELEDKAAALPGGSIDKAFIAEPFARCLNERIDIVGNGVSMRESSYSEPGCISKDYALDPSIDQATEGAGIKWTPDEDNKLKRSVQTHGGKNWDAITALVPGRTRCQCYSRWKDVVYPKIVGMSGRTGKLRADEDIAMMNAVQTHGGKNWDAITALVPGRTRCQCYSRWKDVLYPKIVGMSGRTGKLRADEDITMMKTVQTHGGKNWAAIAALVPGRTQKQCYYR
jgi:hypothetical protein